ncbi:hypothetical protein C2845_PM03G22860 [Panicum miliaceum]|uniref:Disease resistance protein RPM1-like n=1 Tax=Panicum miliaceum TaxID=4540 RepID=A0A3L6TCF7_PANMI|nr:hypothetical protein C2845_PM03G22860 [Panicum miliaceum]
MFLHALYANPRRSKELDGLLHSLRHSNRVGNARRMIMFCYDDLPSQYQSCLLSVSMFPPHTTVRRTSLVRRWAAENFVTGRDGASAVDEAERCFDALIARGLLHPGHVGAAGKVKSCTVHPHVLSFLNKTASDDGLERLDLPPDLVHRVSPRSVIHLLMDSQAAANYSNTTCWGLHWRHTTPAVSKKESSHHDIVTLLNLLPASSGQLGLIKVLNLQGCKGLKKRLLRNICSNIFQLKYLSLMDTDATELPKEINKIRYLETLDIRQTLIQSFPSRTIALPKLMHLLAGHMVHQSIQAIESDKTFSTVHLPHGIGSMTNMQVLSHVEVSPGDEDIEELTNVGRKLQLRKLGVVIRGDKEAHLLQVLLRVVGMVHESLCSLSIRIEAAQPGGDSRLKEVKADDVQAFSSVLIADDMGQSPPKLLESLNIKGKISGLPAWIKQLHRLSKVTLCCTQLTASDIAVLGELLNLRCIRLHHQSYTQKKLMLDNKKFKKLELLVIEGSDISTIHFDDDAAPKLEKITWTFTRVEIALFGINKLLNLKQIEINGSCDPYHLSRIAQDIKVNPSHPILLYNTNRDATAAPSNSFIRE